MRQETSSHGSSDSSDSCDSDIVTLVTLVTDAGSVRTGSDCLTAGQSLSRAGRNLTSARTSQTITTLFF